MTGFDHFYSDPHFSHENVIRYSNRPFASAAQMNEALVERYNAAVRPTDVVLWLGDCFLCSVEEAARIMARLNGRKFLVIGNHDKSPAAMGRVGFMGVATELRMCIASQRVRATHRPYKGTPSAEVVSLEDEGTKPCKGEVLLHGHTHSPRIVTGRQIHLGVDAWDYRPVSYEQVEALVRSVTDG